MLNFLNVKVDYGLGCSRVAQQFPSMCEALGSVPSTIRGEKKELIHIQLGNMKSSGGVGCETVNVLNAIELYI